MSIVRYTGTDKTSSSVSVLTGRMEKFGTITLFPNAISQRFNGII